MEEINLSLRPFATHAFAELNKIRLRFIKQYRIALAQTAKITSEPIAQQSFNPLKNKVT